MKKFEVLDHGHVEYVEHMGSDLTVVNAARVSFNKESSYKLNTKMSSTKKMRS